MKYTVINEVTNQIVRVLNIPNNIVDGHEDKDALISDALELELETDQLAIEGNYPAHLYTFDGSEFHELTLNETLDPLLLSTKELLVLLVTQMNDAGYTLPLHRKFMRTKAHARDAIDLAASQVCEAYVSKGKFTPTEYMLVSDEVKVWRAAGSPSDAIPDMLADFLEVSDFTTAEDAAVDIETQSYAMKHVIRTNRKKRLAGKKAVTAASLEEFKAVALNVIADIEDIQNET